AEATPPAFDPSLGAERLDAAIQSGAAGSIAGSALPWIGAALAVLSLARLGRQAEAERRGQRFLRSHPAGTFSERVRRAIGGAE
ncbi:MAG: hypothetical protein RLP09_13620, partial [Sandaracinaceae bacterium]